MGAVSSCLGTLAGSMDLVAILSILAILGDGLGGIPVLLVFRVSLGRLVVGGSSGLEALGLWEVGRGVGVGC